MSRDIDFSKTLTQDEVDYLAARDDDRLASAKLPKDAEVAPKPDIRGSAEESGLDEVRPDPEEAAKAPEEEPEEKPAPKKR